MNANNLIELWNKPVEVNSCSTAVVCKDKSYTYAEIDEKSNQLARMLVNMGVKFESLVGVFLDS